MIKMITTTFGVGYLRPAPGTWGSLAALPLAWGVHELFGLTGFIVACVIVFFLGWWATAQHTNNSGDHDPSEIVVDEVIGQWIALLPVFIGAAHMGADTLALWPGWVTAFIGFRLFDITKIGPIGWTDRRGDALGVMLDDVIAGIYAALLVMIMAALSHGVLM
jgi:phosphatidylglycerophosphatase A